MVAAAIVEAVRLGEVHRLGLENSTDPVPMSVFWLVPQYFIIGAAEIMVNIGTLEMFYSEVSHEAWLHLAVGVDLVQPIGVLCIPEVSCSPRALITRTAAGGLK